MRLGGVCRFNGRILLANSLQSSKRTFSWGSFLSFFAFKEGMWDTQIAALLSSPTVSGRILLANPLQSSKRTLSWGSFLSFFAFKEGMWDTQIAALLSSPTVSGRFLDV